MQSLASLQTPCVSSPQELNGPVDCRAIHLRTISNKRAKKRLPREYGSVKQAVWRLICCHSRSKNRALFAITFQRRKSNSYVAPVNSFHSLLTAQELMRSEVRPLTDAPNSSRPAVDPALEEWSPAGLSGVRPRTTGCILYGSRIKWN